MTLFYFSYSFQIYKCYYPALQGRLLHINTRALWKRTSLRASERRLCIGTLSPSERSKGRGLTPGQTQCSLSPFSPHCPQLVYYLNCNDNNFQLLQQVSGEALFYRQGLSICDRSLGLSLLPRNRVESEQG